MLETGNETSMINGINIEYYNVAPAAVREFIQQFSDADATWQVLKLTFSFLTSLS